MGGYFSSNFNMSDIEDNNSDHLSDSDDDLFQNELNDNELSEHYLVIILRQLIESGDINFPHHTTRDGQLPKIAKGPDLDTLKKSDIFQQIKHSAGLNNSVEEKSNGNLIEMLNKRQNGGSFVRRDKCRINNIYLPNSSERQLIQLDSKIFCGSFTRDGDRFLTASQDQEIRIFDSSNTNYRELKTIPAKHVSWCILDLAFSPCSKFVAYSTWAECLHLFPISDDSDSYEHIQCIDMDPNVNRFGAFSIAFSNSGDEIISGGSDGQVYFVDLNRNERTLRVPVRNDAVSTDVNCVGFIDESSNLFFSGSEDAVIRIWDRRCLNENTPEPSGILVGHVDGITFIDSKNDGRFILSNSKDQSLKIWDLRKFSPKEAEANVSSIMNARSRWDYRWDKVPKSYYEVKKPIEGDTSVVTFKGHRIQKSLIRAKFSPAQTTGQRYIYTGCSTGRLIIYDILTGKMMNGGIETHKDIVRDVSWHPHRNEILTSSWDYCVNISTFQDASTEQKKDKKPLSSYVPSFLEDSDLMDVPQQVRRSRRIAQRAAGRASSSRNNTGNR